MSVVVVDVCGCVSDVHTDSDSDPSSHRQAHSQHGVCVQLWEGVACALCHITGLRVAALTPTGVLSPSPSSPTTLTRVASPTPTPATAAPDPSEPSEPSDTPSTSKKRRLSVSESPVAASPPSPWPSSSPRSVWLTSGSASALHSLVSTGPSTIPPTLPAPPTPSAAAAAAPSHTTDDDAGGTSTAARRKRMRSGFRTMVRLARASDQTPTVVAVLCRGHTMPDVREETAAVLFRGLKLLLSEKAASVVFVSERHSHAHTGTPADGPSSFSTPDTWSSLLPGSHVLYADSFRMCFPSLLPTAPWQGCLNAGPTASTVVPGLLLVPAHTNPPTTAPDPTKPGSPFPPNSFIDLVSVQRWDDAAEAVLHLLHGPVWDLYASVQHPRSVQFLSHLSSSAAAAAAPGDALCFFVRFLCERDPPNGTGIALAAADHLYLCFYSQHSAGYVVQAVTDPTQTTGTWTVLASVLPSDTATAVKGEGKEEEGGGGAGAGAGAGVGDRDTDTDRDGDRGGDDTDADDGDDVCDGTVSDPFSASLLAGRLHSVIGTVTDSVVPVSVPISADVGGSSVGSVGNQPSSKGPSHTNSHSEPTSTDNRSLPPPPHPASDRPAPPRTPPRRSAPNDAGQLLTRLKEVGRASDFPVTVTSPDGVWISAGDADHPSWKTLHRFFVKAGHALTSHVHGVDYLIDREERAVDDREELMLKQTRIRRDRRAPSLQQSTSLISHMPRPPVLSPYKPHRRHYSRAPTGLSAMEVLRQQAGGGGGGGGGGGAGAGAGAGAGGGGVSRRRSGLLGPPPAPNRSGRPTKHTSTKTVTKAESGGERDTSAGGGAGGGGGVLLPGSRHRVALRASVVEEIHRSGFQSQAQSESQSDDQVQRMADLVVQLVIAFGQFSGVDLTSPTSLQWQANAIRDNVEHAVRFSGGVAHRPSQSLSRVPYDDSDDTGVASSQIPHGRQYTEAELLRPDGVGIGGGLSTDTEGGTDFISRLRPHSEFVLPRGRGRLTAPSPMSIPRSGSDAELAFPLAGGAGGIGGLSTPVTTPIPQFGGIGMHTPVAVAGGVGVPTHNGGVGGVGGVGRPPASQRLLAPGFLTGDESMDDSEPLVMARRTQPQPPPAPSRPSARTRTRTRRP